MSTFRGGDFYVVEDGELYPLRYGHSVADPGGGGDPTLDEQKRQGLARPFAEDGPWNTLIPLDATYYDSPMLRTVTPAEQSALGQSNNRRHWYVADSSVSLNYVENADPTWTVDVPAHNYNPFGRDWPADTFTIDAPADLVEDQDVDHILVIINKDTGAVTELWQAETTDSPLAEGLAQQANWEKQTLAARTITNRIFGGSQATGYARSDIVTDPGAGSTIDPPTGIGNSDGTRASNFSWAAGVITGRDMAAATIDHALVIGLGYLTLSNDTWWSPATGPDNGGHSGFTDMGDRIAIDRDTPMPSGMSALGQKFFVCLQEYGAYVGDFVGSAYPHFYIDAATVNPADTYDLFVWFFGNPDPDIDKMLPYLRVVNRDPGG
jgi:hypothetical protein